MWYQLARQFERPAAEQYTQGDIGGFLHLYSGEEAIAVGTLSAAEPGDDVVSTYREHVHALVWGISPRAVLPNGRLLGGYAIVGEPLSWRGDRNGFMIALDERMQALS